MEDNSLKVLANLLSTLTIMSCVFLKVPQIVSMRERRSADGIYIQAMLMEVSGFTIMTLYSFVNDYSLMTYLEYPVILIQVYILFYYVLMYKRLLHQPIATLAAVMYVTVVAGFVFKIIPKEFLSYGVPFCTPLSGFAKVTNIYGIIKANNADGVSLATWIISVLTNLARIFTVYLDSKDPKLLGNFFVSTILSAAVLGTAIYYQFFVPPPPPPGRPRRMPSYRRNSETFDKYD